MPEEHGSTRMEEDLSIWGPGWIRALCDRRPPPAIRAPRGPATGRAGVHGSPCGFRLFAPTWTSQDAVGRAGLTFDRPADA